MASTSIWGHPFLAALLLLQASFLTQCSCCVAKVPQGNWLGHHRRGWGLKNHAKLPESRTTLDSFFLQVRGGSNYGDSRDWDDRRKPPTNQGYNDDDRYNDQGFDARDWEEGDYQNDRDDYRRGNSDSRYDGYDDDGRGSRSSSSSSNAVQSSLSSFQAKIKNGDRKLGLPLLGLGVIFSVLGVSLFFNKALMRLGNLMFIAGIPTTIGPSRTAGYFFRPEKWRATACLFAGIFLVFVGWPIVGMALEIFGILNLFGNMFPMFWAIFKNLPIVSSLTKNAGGGGGGRPSYSYDRERDQDYRDDPYADDRRGYSNYGDDDAERFY